jgi:uncharacterized protein involved in exopolysaccharide biosynthesis
MSLLDELRPGLEEVLTKLVRKHTEPLQAELDAARIRNTELRSELAAAKAMVAKLTPYGN